MITKNELRIVRVLEEGVRMQIKREEQERGGLGQEEKRVFMEDHKRGNGGIKIVVIHWGVRQHIVNKKSERSKI